MPGPNWALSDDCTHITVTFPTDPPVAQASAFRLPVRFALDDVVIARGPYPI